ncbi:MAG: hypothetical protein AB1847_07800 [bacterium]
MACKKLGIELPTLREASGSAQNMIKEAREYLIEQVPPENVPVDIVILGSLARYEAIMEEISRQGLNNIQFADKLVERLGLLPSGAELLVRRDYWPMETGLRIAEALNLGIELSVKRDNG